MLFGFCARAATYRAPLLDHHAWRQADTAAISRLVGFHPESGRILSALCFVGSCLLVWRFVRRRHGEEAGLVAAQTYLERRSRASLVALLVASSLVGAIKLPLWAPVAGLFLEVDGPRVWRRWELWGMASLNIVVALAWYSHAHRLAQVSGLSFGLTDKLFDAATVFSWDFPLGMLDRMVRDILEPIGLVA